MQEDDVISIFSEELRGKEFLILAEGANQVGRFRFRLPSGREKSPDLVVYRKRVLAIFEAKVMPEDLWKRGRSAESDYDALCFLSECKEEQSRLKDEALRRLRGASAYPEQAMSVVLGLISSGSFLAVKPDLRQGKFILVRVNYCEGKCYVEKTLSIWSSVWD